MPFPEALGYRYTYYSSDATSIIASYYDRNTTSMTDKQSGFGLETAQMKKKATFAYWDFDNIWGISSSVNNGYPYLKLTGEYNTFELEGSGTSRDPYIIYTEAELAAIARGEVTNSFTAYYMLGADLTLGSKYWTPIGGNGMPVFSGTFDGDGHTISGLDIAFPAYTYEGLFGTVTGTVKNLNVVGTVSDAFTAGIVVGYLNEGVVEGCSGGGSVTGRNDLGGLVGYCLNGTIRNCYATASVTSTSEKQADGCGGEPTRLRWKLH